MKGNLNIGVVGLGYWGPNLARNFQSLPGCNLQVLCDQDQHRLDHLKKFYPQAEMYARFEEALNSADLDAVAISTPVRLHHRMAKASLLAGKHTMIEKPMASSVEQCEELIELAAARGLVLMVGHTFLYSPAVRKIKEIVDSGGIGKLRYVSSRRLNLGLFQKDINVVWDLAPHDISIIEHVMGERACTVNCQGKANVSGGVEDVSNLSLHFPNGGFATIHSSWLDPKKVRDMAFVGTEKMILYDDLEPLQKIKIYDQRVETPPYYDTFAEFQYSYHYGDMYAPYIKQEEPLHIECQHFIDCIRREQEPLSGGVKGLELVRILEAASRSLANNGARIEIARSVAAPVGRPSVEAAS